MTGFRTEQLYGEGYRDAASVMAHETFELENTDILETLAEGILKNTEISKSLMHIANAINGNINDEETESFLDKAYDDNDIGTKFFENVLIEIKKATGKDIKYALWLCDSVEDIRNEYETENIDIKLTDFDEYETSDIVLSDIGGGGKLYGYESYPQPIES